MKDAYFKIDSKTLKKIISETLKNKSPFLKLLFNSTTKLIFENDTIKINALMFKYYIKIKEKPYYLNGTYMFEHNLPLDKINTKSLPQNIKITSSMMAVYVPENLITKNIVLKNLTFDDDKIIVELTT
ncbi:hypothetical protein OSSY52_04750 [Tepiditoga spiralis]|uniref:Uncharacterized protein n=1 Tax=Tepiditoga spiralis TaxID=2108365 RepID=A0A7G1G5L6_9BACT|nr:hypothetical protein [Tepiditoga spiralis]BBE30334.1 hypothetical protein OSSY52_04750 [Tepiditoga spiralis]